jgi:hypothetical protein
MAPAGCYPCGGNVTGVEGFVDRLTANALDIAAPDVNKCGF